VIPLAYNYQGGGMVEKIKALMDLVKGGFLVKTVDGFYSNGKWAIHQRFLSGDDVEMFEIEPSEHSITQVVQKYAGSGYAFKCGFYAVTIDGRSKNYVFDLPQFFKVFEVPKVIVDGIEKILSDFKERRLYVALTDTLWGEKSLDGLLCWYGDGDDLLACVMVERVKDVDLSELIKMLTH